MTSEPDKQTQQALEKAMFLFWSKGVANASYPDIVAATGLSRKALYARWPDKTALVHASLNFYRETVLAQILAQLTPPGMKALDHFWRYLEAGMTSGSYNGCLLFRTAGQDGGADPEISAALSDHLHLLKQAFTAAFTQAIQDGDLCADFDIDQAIWQVLAILTTLSSFGGNPSLVNDMPALIAVGRSSSGLK